MNYLLRGDNYLNKYFEPVAFEAELGGLPGKFAPPQGALLLALHEGRPAGCVALRRIDMTTCEMKRMFVDPDFQGLGIGVTLGKAIIEEGRRLGYKKMVLDSGARQIEAHTLYRKLGFKGTPPYYDLPDDLANWLTFMELSLTEA